MNNKTKYLSSAALLLVSTVAVKIIGALYKIPLTASIGAVGRGYFSTAYNLYMPLHVILMGAFPIALSRLVSRYHALGDAPMVASLKSGARRLFLIIGLVGSAALLLIAVPYATLIAGAPKSVYTVLVLAPALLLSCICAAYRGYYEGFLDMKPTAVSQLLEALFKLVFGLLFARAVMQRLLVFYDKTGTVLWMRPTDVQEARSCIYPLSSAAAMLGVTVGTLLGLCFLWWYDRRHTPLPKIKTPSREGRRALLRFSFPILMSCAVQSVFQFLDTASIQYALKSIPPAALQATLSASLAGTAVEESDLPSFVYGLFCTALDFKNLIPGITMVLGVCAVPAICREFESGHREKTQSLMNAVYRYTSLLSVYGGVCLALFAGDILQLFYASSPEIIAGCEATVVHFAWTVPLYSLASTAVFCVQSLGKPELSIPSYIVSGVIRVTLNLLLVGRGGLLMDGAVLAGAVGYLVLFVWNLLISKCLSGAKLSVTEIAVKPLLVGISAFFCMRRLLLLPFFINSLFFKLLIEVAVFTVLYNILCVFLRCVKYEEIFSVVKIKKMP